VCKAARRSHPDIFSIASDEEEEAPAQPQAPMKVKEEEPDEDMADLAGKLDSARVESPSCPEQGGLARSSGADQPSPAEQSDPARDSGADQPSPAEHSDLARESGADEPQPADQEDESHANEDEPQAEEVIPRDDCTALKDAIRKKYTVPQLRVMCQDRGLRYDLAKEGLINRLIASQNWASEKNIAAIVARMTGRPSTEASLASYSCDEAAEAWLRAWMPTASGLLVRRKRTSDPLQRETDSP
jgi:hypothetical protein